MIWPCPHKVDCVGSDYPLMNVSSEGPDMPQFTAVGFCCNGQQAWSYSLASQVDAEDQLQRLMFLGCPDCAEENSYCADANCPDGTFLARYCLPTSQAEADTLANLHEAAMAPYCDGQLGDLFSATCSCPDGSQSMTAYSEISDADALNACQSVPRDCNVTPATNTQQICFSRCPDGTLFYWVVAAGTFYASTVAEANAMAYAVACQRAQIFRVCISGAVPRACLNNPYNIILTATSGRTYSWNVSGTLPPGLTATPIGQNGLQIQGTPTTAGTYTLVLTATDEVGNYMVKTITITVWGIVQTSLPDGVLAADYDQQLTSVGGTAPYTYTLVSGGFPLGVDITSSGLITGVVGEEGVFTPSIRVRDHAGRTCTKDFTLTVPPGCPTPTPVVFTIPATPDGVFNSNSLSPSAFAVIGDKIAKWSENLNLGCIEIVDFSGVPAVTNRFLMNAETGWACNGAIYEPTSGLIAVIAVKAANNDRLAFFDPVSGYVDSVALTSQSNAYLWSGVLMRGSANKVAFLRNSATPLGNDALLVIGNTSSKTAENQWTIAVPADGSYGNSGFCYSCSRVEFYFYGRESFGNYNLFAISAADGSVVRTMPGVQAVGIAYLDSEDVIVQASADGLSILKISPDDGSTITTLALSALIGKPYAQIYDPVRYDFKLDAVAVASVWNDLAIAPFDPNTGLVFLKASDLSLAGICKTATGAFEYTDSYLLWCAESNGDAYEIRFNGAPGVYEMSRVAPVIT